MDETETRYREIAGRTLGYWNFLPEERYHDDFALTDANIKIVSLRRTDKNWELLCDFDQLKEVTAISPTPEQLSMLFSLKKLKRLRLASIRKTDLSGINKLEALEELALINVSGLQDMESIARLPRLKSLFVENIRSLSDFSGLITATNLRCLCVDGTSENNQEIASLGFLADLPNLNHLCLNAVRYRSEFPAFGFLNECRNLRSLYVNSCYLGIEDWAYLSANFGHLFVRNEPLLYVGGDNESFETIEEAEQSGSEVLSLEIRLKGFRYFNGRRETGLKKLQQFKKNWAAAKKLVQEIS